LKLSAEFLILFVATIAIAGFVATQMVPIVQQQAQSANVMISNIALYGLSGGTKGRVYLTIKNVGTMDITKVEAVIYEAGTTDRVASPYTWSSSPLPLPPGAEAQLTAELTPLTNKKIEPGKPYTVEVKASFGDIERIFVYKIVALSW